MTSLQAAIERVAKGYRADFADPLVTISVSDRDLLLKAARDNAKSFSALAMYGVSEERARSVSNGIGVLVTRMDRELASLRQALATAIPEADVRRMLVEAIGCFGTNPEQTARFMIAEYRARAK